MESLFADQTAFVPKYAPCTCNTCTIAFSCPSRVVFFLNRDMLAPCYSSYSSAHSLRYSHRAIFSSSLLSVCETSVCNSCSRVKSSPLMIHFFLKLVDLFLQVQRSHLQSFPILFVPYESFFFVAASFTGSIFLFFCHLFALLLFVCSSNSTYFHNIILCLASSLEHQQFFCNFI